MAEIKIIKIRIKTMAEMFRPQSAVATMSAATKFAAIKIVARTIRRLSLHQPALTRVWKKLLANISRKFATRIHRGKIVRSLREFLPPKSARTKALARSLASSPCRPWPTAPPSPLMLLPLAFPEACLPWRSFCF